MPAETVRHAVIFRWLLLGGTALLFSLDAGSRTLHIDLPDPWFSYEVVVNAESIPVGVAFQATSNTLINFTETPLYIVKPTEQSQEWIGVLPGNVLPLMKIVNDIAFRFIYSEGKWFEHKMRSIGGRSFGSIDVFEALGQDDRDALRGPMGQGRPLAAIPPEPKSVRINGYLGPRRITIDLQVTFGLNEKYNPAAYAGAWYEISGMYVVASELPPGMRIEAPPPQFDVSRDLEREIFYTGDTPFYLIKEFSEPLDWLGKLSNDVLPYVKLVSGQRFTATDFSYSTVDSMWRLEANYPALQLEPEWLDLFDPNLNLIKISKDCRPVDVELPAPSPFTILAYYGGNQYSITGEIRYLLNAAYHPTAGDPQRKDCSSPPTKS